MTVRAFLGARPLIVSLVLTSLLLAALAGLRWYQVPRDNGLEVAVPADSELTGDPFAPSLELVGQIGGIGSGLAVQGPYAYVGVGPRLIVVDVSNPALPWPVGQSRPLSANVRRIVADGLYAFVAAADGTLTVFDLSNPADPIIVASSRYIRRGIHRTWLAPVPISTWRNGLAHLGTSRTQVGFSSST